MPEKELIKFLSQFITENRKNKFEEIIKLRTKHITVILEDIFQPHNASAVLRSCDCFGIQDVHIIENKNKYKVNPDVALGSANWLTLHHYNKQKDNTLCCINKLKKNGYRIIATTPHENNCNLEDFKIDKKIALLFGTEMKGLSEDAINNADGFLKIPMYGFTESLNISVSAAICLHYLTFKLRKSLLKWQLTKKETDEILLQWVRNSLKNHELLEKEYKKRKF
ncbi:MAG: RNA methyltransferase [Bacteroidales bacterium]|nr:RNA methyltransferase [Bacteroidales bacterium]